MKKNTFRKKGILKKKVFQGLWLLSSILLIVFGNIYYNEAVRLDKEGGVSEYKIVDKSARKKSGSYNIHIKSGSKTRLISVSKKEYLKKKIGDSIQLKYSKDKDFFIHSGKIGRFKLFIHAGYVLLILLFIPYNSVAKLLAFKN